MVLLKEDYRDLDIYPSLNELLVECLHLRKNIIKGKFNSIHEYLDIHFKLLREDFIACLRKGVQSYRSKETHKGVDVYENIKIYKELNKYNKECLKIKIPALDDDSKKFMNGSLLVFTKNNFDSSFFAKVVQRNTKKNEATIELVNLGNAQTHENYTMLESGAYFDPYFQVLSVFQSMSTNNFPMEKYIIEVDTASVCIPRYLLTSAQKYVIGKYTLPPQLIPKLEKNILNLNPAQFTAFRAAITQEFVVIQGPPGTGKTFLGLKIAETLIKNSHFWYKNSPILIVSQKNYALDQFLEGLVPITNRLIRVGGNSKSVKLVKYNLNYEDTNSKRCAEDYLTKMKQALIVGMTTSLAARRRADLEKLKSPIVIIEEAAEVLEGHVIASITSHCQHLILLGDHEQLQPITSDFQIGKKYHLGVSLFERMINNGIQCYQLNVQHRMRPEMSNLLKVTIYPYLIDHESVLNRPPILGVKKSVFFFDHRWPEESSQFTSKKNSKEAEFVVAFARHLVLNEHKISEIVILSPYAAQLPELEKRAATKKELQGVRIMSLDAFQGKEADIVLLSLVANENIGFLYVKNRICVAMSRARNGFYLFGNIEMMASKSNVWYKIHQCLKMGNSVGAKLPLQCQVHPQTVTEMGCVEDFLQVRNGGCFRKCKISLSCGHYCDRLCHTKYKTHNCKKQSKKATTTVTPLRIHCRERIVNETNPFLSNRATTTVTPSRIHSREMIVNETTPFLSNSIRNNASDYINNVNYYDNRNIFKVFIDWIVNMCK